MPDMTSTNRVEVDWGNGSKSTFDFPDAESLHQFKEGVEVAYAWLISHDRNKASLYSIRNAANAYNEFLNNRGVAPTGDDYNAIVAIINGSNP